MTSSIFLPQGTWGQSLTGINSSPLISWPVVCVVVSQPFVLLLWEPLVIVSESPYKIYISSTSCFCTVHHSVFAVQQRTLVSHQSAVCLIAAASALSWSRWCLLPWVVLLLDSYVVKDWEQRLRCLCYWAGCRFGSRTAKPVTLTRWHKRGYKCCFAIISLFLKGRESCNASLCTVNWETVV